MKKKTRKQLQKMMQRGFEPTGFLTGAASALVVTTLLRTKSMQNLEHKVGERLGEAWPKISSGINGMTSMASELLSHLHLGSHNGHGKSTGSKKGMETPEESEGFSTHSPRAIKPGRSSKKGYTE